MANFTRKIFCGEFVLPFLNFISEIAVSSNSLFSLLKFIDPCLSLNLFIQLVATDKPKPI